MQQRFKRITNLFLALALPGILVVFLFRILRPAQVAVGSVYRVAKTGSSVDGLSWSTAFTDVQDALSIAVTGDEIWVAKGVYPPGVTVSETFQLQDGGWSRHSHSLDDYFSAALSTLVV